MTTLIVGQAAVAKVEPLILLSAPTAWSELINVPDYSVPDANEIYLERDPENTARRIQPGAGLIVSPIFVYNYSTVRCTVSFRVVTESGVEVDFLTRAIAAGETWDALIQGLTLLKRSPVSENGDRLQVRAEFLNSLNVLGNVSYGAAEQNFPDRS